MVAKDRTIANAVVARSDWRGVNLAKACRNSRRKSDPSIDHDIKEDDNKVKHQGGNGPQP